MRDSYKIYMRRQHKNRAARTCTVSGCTRRKHKQANGKVRSTCRECNNLASKASRARTAARAATLTVAQRAVAAAHAAMESSDEE